MPTNDSIINIYEKKLLSLTGLKTNFLEYLSDKIDERTAAIFQQTSGVLDGDEIEIDPSGNDEFDLNITNASRCVVGTGQIIDLSLLNGAGISTDVPIENTLAATYYVGIKFMSVADGIELNPRTGDPEYPKFRDSYGELDNPTDAVDDPGVKLTLNCNSITEAGVDHSGRTVKVYLANPVSPVEATAYFQGTIVYNSPNNDIEIPYSGGDGPLGQDTSVDPPSTTLTDYIVSIEGATWRKNTDLRNDSDYAFIGTIIGGGAGNPIGVVDLSDQNPIFINTLDRAYDGASGGGSGRLIFVDGEAVELRARSGNTDELLAALRIDRKGDSDSGSSALQTIADEKTGDTANQLHMVPLTHSVGNLALDNPATSQAATAIVAKTGAVDWSASEINVYTDLAWLQGFSTIDGLYRIPSVPGVTNLTLQNLDGSVPAFPGGETGQVTILRLAVATVPQTWDLSGLFGGGTLIAGPNETSAPSGGGDDARSGLTLLNASVDGLHAYDGAAAVSPRVVTWINVEGVLKTISGMLIAPAPGQVTNTSGGLVRTAAGVNSNTPLDWIPTADDLLGVVLDPSGSTREMHEPSGRRATPHVFNDDFHYHENKWTSGPTAPPQYDVTLAGGGSGQVFMIGGGNPAWDDWAHGGVVQLQTNVVLDPVTLDGPFAWWIDPTKWFTGFFARGSMGYEPGLVNDRIVRIGMTNFTSLSRIYFEIDGAANGNENWHMVCTDGTNTVKADSGFGAQYDGANNPQFSNLAFQIIGDQAIRWATGEAPTPKTLDLTTATPGAITLSAAANKLYAPFNFISVTDPTLHVWRLDRWEVWDMTAVGIISGGDQVY